MESKERWKFWLCFLFLMIPCVAFSQNWPQWRGPSRDGVIQDFQSPDIWPPKLKLLWKTAVGSGISSPVVSNGKAWIHTRRDKNEVVTCLDLKTGKVIWSKNYPAPFKPNPPAAKMGNGGPFATPVLHANKLYTLGISAILSCFDAYSGELKWQKSFGDINTTAIFCGTSASPLIDQKNLIVQIGDDLRGFLFAFDLDTGQEKWKWSSGNVAYASPIIATFEGVRQIVAHTNDAIAGVDAQHGKLLWKEPFTETKWRENIVSPIQYKKLLILSNGAQGATAFQIVKENDQWKAKKVWQNTDIAMYMSTPVLNGDYLFGMSAKRKGMFFCIKTASGEVLWSTKGDEGENAAILQAGDVLFYLTDNANLKVVRKNKDKYEQVASYSVAESSTWAHPVVWNNQILIKDESNISLWSL